MIDKKEKYYNYELLLYTENEKHIEILNYITKNYNFAYKIHDKEDNKPHIHLLVFFENKRYISGILKEIDIELNLINPVHNKKGAIRYLVHKDNPEKYQYNIEDIVSNIDLSSYFNNTSIELVDIRVIFDYISSQRRFIFYKDITEYCIKNALWSTYRRSYSIIKDIINEHNQDYVDPRKTIC